jgi:hypothetical protein
MDKDKLRGKLGNIAQLAYARRAHLTDGKADGMKIIDAANAAGVSLTLFESRCLDIARLSYKGVNMSFGSKAGWVSPQNYASVESDFTKHFQAGMLYTCGLENIGPPCEKDGAQLPQHGTIGMTTAEDVCARVDWESSAVIVQGTVRNSRLFGGSLALHRKITIPVFESSVTIEDTVANEGFTKEDIMLLYHFNFGYPMLDESAKLYINEDSMKPRDEVAESGKDKWNVFEAPTAGRPEEVFYHDPKKEEDGLVHVKLENSALGMGGELIFDKAQLPKLVQWKSMMAGDYALGLEPATTFVEGYANEKKAGRVTTLAPGEKKNYKLTLKFYDL